MFWWSRFSITQKQSPVGTLAAKKMQTLKFEYADLVPHSLICGLVMVEVVWNNKSY